MFTFEKRFTYVLRTSLGEFGTVEAHFVYMIILCLRAYYGPSFATGELEFMSDILPFAFNLQNIFAILGVATILNGTGVAIVTAYKAADKDGNVLELFLYSMSILQGYVCYVLILPNIQAFETIAVA